MNKTLLLGAFLGLTGVIAGALVNHWIDPQYAGKVISAVRLQQIHALVIVAIGLSFYAALPDGLARNLKIAVGLFTLGIALFSGGIYLRYFFGFSIEGILIPIGGAIVMLGWLAVMWAAAWHKASG